MIRLGLVGLGWHGSRYATHLAKGEVPGVKLVAVARRDRAQGEAQARELGVRFHGSVEELAHDSGVDAVVVASPGSAHAKHLAVVMRAKKPALVEKPLAHSLEDARALVKEARELGARVMVAHTLRWEPLYAEATKVARAESGNVRLGMVVFHRTDLGARASADFQETDHHRALFAVGTHYLDWASQIFPEGFVQAVASEGPPADGLACNVVLKTKGDATFVLALNLHAPTSQEVLSVHFTDERYLHGMREPQRLAVLRPKAKEQNVAVPPPSPTLPRVLGDFRDFLEGKIDNPVPLEIGARAVALAEACARSIAQAAPVAIPEGLT